MRRMVIDSANLAWRHRWNHDDNPYLEVADWTVDWRQAPASDEW